MQMFKYFQHKPCSVNHNHKHIMKLKEILGKDKWNHSKEGNLDVDTAGIANGIKTLLLTSSKCFISDPFFKNTLHSIAIIKINVPTTHEDINRTVGEKIRGRKKKSTMVYFTDYTPNDILVFCFIIQHLLNKEIKTSTVFYDILNSPLGTTSASHKIIKKKKKAQANNQNILLPKWW